MRTIRLQKQLNRSENGKNYYKYVVVVPSEAIEILEWFEVRELHYQVKGHNLILNPAIQ